jgi:hypothetical protein
MPTTDKNITVSSSGGGGGTSLANRVVVTQASDLAGILDSTKEYFIDTSPDMGSQSVEVPAGGLFITGYNSDISILFSSTSNHTMFTSPVGGSGSLILESMGVEETGANSKVFDIIDSDGTHAFTMKDVRIVNPSSMGEVNGYRQGLERVTSRTGGKPELTLSGAWSGGYFIDTSIIRGLTDGAYTLFKAGTGFVMQSRFRSNQNLDLPANASFLDFSSTNFPNSSTLQVSGAIVTRNGVANATDINITPNIDEANLSCAWDGNLGVPNTFEGGRITVTSAAQTAIVAGSTFYTIASAAHTVSDLQHFDNPADMQLRHLGVQPRGYKVTTQFSIEGTQGNFIAVRIVKWDDSASVFVNSTPQTRQINALQGNRDVAFITINENVTLDKDDYIFFEVANNSGNDNVTLEADSYFITEER